MLCASQVQDPFTRPLGHQPAWGDHAAAAAAGSPATSPLADATRKRRLSADMERHHSSESSGGSLMPGLGSAGPQRWTVHTDAASHWATGGTAAAFLESAAGPGTAEIASLMMRDMFPGMRRSPQRTVVLR